MADEYYLAKEYDTERAHVQIFRPILTEEERAKRMQAIYDAAYRLAIAQLREEARRSDISKFPI